jgi:CheY-like chemotaxis protein
MMESTYNWTGKTILIAEDAETSVKYFQAALRRTGTKILWARNGLEAFEFVKNTEVSLVLMDLDMPVMNGLVSARLIKEHSPNLPIIAQSAHVQIGDHQASIEVGCDAYITKPISLEFLLTTISRFLEK